MTQDWNGVERRRCPRLTEALKVRYRLLEGMDHGTLSERFLNARTVNISASGVLLETREELREGQNIVMEVQFEKDEQLARCNGRVVRVRKSPEGLFLSGLEFHHLSEQQIQMFVEYVDEKMRGEGK